MREGEGNPVFSFRLAAVKEESWREVAKLAGYDLVGDLIRDVMDAVTERNHGRVHGILRRVDKAAGVQLDLALMSQPGAAVLPRKRAARAKRALVRAKGGSPP